MPQMSPLNWIILFFLFLFALALTITKTFPSATYSLNKSLTSSETTSYFKWLW